MIRKILITASAIAFLGACAGTPEVQTGANAETINGNLNKVDNSKADLAYLDPSADFGKYSKLLLRPLGVDNIEIVQPNRSNSIGRNKDWELTDKDKQSLQDAYMDAMTKYLSDKGDYPIVTEPGDDVLEIGAKITAIAPNAAKDDSQSRAMGRSRVYTEGAGAIAVVVAYADSQTGEVLGLAKDSRSSSSNWGANNSVSNMSDVRQMFNSWAIQIRKGLDTAHGR